MCELLGISNSRPTKTPALLRAFQKRGGEAADNPDGWGLAYLHNGSFALEKEPLPAAHSQRFIELAASIETDLLIGHVRKARLPRVNTVANTHPFRHSCCGQEWIFAHNGLVPEIIEIAHRNPLLPCAPDGETDSEHAFCHLLSDISQHFHEPPADGLESWFTSLAALSDLIAERGKFNFLISDGRHLIAYGHDRLHYREYRGDAGERTDWVATTPLTSDDWEPFEPGELRIYQHGQPLVVHRRRARNMPDTRGNRAINTAYPS
jgi:glutamine amidotransferase